jgi:hypothetical protein
MAVRVTADEVKAIISTRLTDLDAFITAANQVVDVRLKNKGFTDPQLKEIERWLAAHFVAIHSPNKTREKIDTASEGYQSGSLGKALDFTAYGQQVKVLDWTGTLSAVGQRKAVLRVMEHTVD